MVLNDHQDMIYIWDVIRRPLINADVEDCYIFLAGRDIERYIEKI